MITFGYAKSYRYTDAGVLEIQVRIPSVHGAFHKSDYLGRTIRNYVEDKDLPWVESVLLPQLPNDGDVVVVAGLNASMNDFIVLGITGANYDSGITNVDLK